MSKYMRTVPLFLTALILVCAHVVHADELERMFQDSVVFTNVGYTSGSTVISNFPLRVDISATRPNGFEYSLAGDRASQIRFNYHEEFVQDFTNVVIDTVCNYSVSNWNSGGVSTLYVQLPRFSDSSRAKLTMYWNPVDYAELPLNSSIKVPRAVTNAAECAEWNQAILDQAENPNYIVNAPACRRVKRSETQWEMKLLNYWLTVPEISKSEWKQGDPSAIVTVGRPASLTPDITVRYVDRNSSAELGEAQPLSPGSYSAVVTAAETAEYAPLEKRLNFTIGGGVDAGGIAAVEDYKYSLKFALTGADVDLSQAAKVRASSAGVSDVQVGYNFMEEIEGSGEITLGIWFKFDSSFPESTNGDAANTALISMCGNGAQQNGPLSIVLDNYNGRGRKTIRSYGCSGKNAQGNTSGADFVTISDHPWADDNWHFAMATRNKAGDVSLFVDGEYKKTKLSVGGNVYEVGRFFFDESNGNKLSIGCDAYSHNSATRGFNGWLAEAQLYDRVLTEAEMVALYANGHPRRLTGREAGLIAYYPLNDRTTSGEFSGGSFNDANRNGDTHKANIVGPVLWESAALPFVSGSSDFSSYPVLVRIAEGKPAGFSFDTIAYGKTKLTLTREDFYREVRFYDEQGRPLDYEIDQFDEPVGNGGEVQIWVKPIKVKSGSWINMCWGQAAYTMLPENESDTVWTAAKLADKDRIRDAYVLNYEAIVDVGRIYQRSGVRYQNRWLVEPSLEFYQWEPGSPAPAVNLGMTCGGVPTVVFVDRNSGERFATLPADRQGEYRAVFTFAETLEWSSLEAMRDFHVVVERGNHDTGDANYRVLLANDDYSIPGGLVISQSYDDNEDGWGTPYWTHHEAASLDDVSDFDSTKLFNRYNIFAGSFHEYMNGTERIWGLENVRFGNLFTNARIAPGERDDEGLKPEQNYLPWNPSSRRMLAYEGFEVGAFHRYAGTFLLQNVCDGLTKNYAQICSPCYQDGIGTIYFDVVNAFTGNVRDADGKANYAIVVEVATNVLGRVGNAPVDAVYPRGIISARDESGNEIFDHYFHADWKPVDMNVIRFHGDSGVEADDCDPAFVTRELELDITDGGTRSNFYRVYVPLDYDCPARFRIRRVKIDEERSLNPDAEAYVIVDNVICSKSREMMRFVPYGLETDDTKTGKQWLGHEMAFTPSFPGVGDAVLPRVRAVDRDGNDAASDIVKAVSMHYRWTYLNQSKTDWLVADLDPVTLKSETPLLLPAGLPGDIEFWFDGVQDADYYCYANYSGTKVGVPLYSESCAIVTNGWNGAEAGWKVRIREGRSKYEQALLIVRDPDGVVTNVPMQLVADHQWRGYYQTLKAVRQGVDARIEFRNCEEDGNVEWSWNTNRWYLSGNTVTPPFSGRMVEGGSNDWTHVEVDAHTGYIMFQADDSAHGLSIVRADYQNFNHWTDGHEGVFVGTAGNDSSLPASGVAPTSRDYGVDYSVDQTEDSDESVLWTATFDAHEFPMKKTFPAGEQTSGNWRLGKGRFINGFYDEPKSGTALQMAGCGEGYAEFSDKSIGKWPRGVEKVTFSARLAQPIGFDDFSYCDGNMTKKSYCFSACGAFDHNSNLDFTGNASLSLVGYYRRGKGCYEMRWEQIIGKIDTAGVVQGPHARGQRLSIYRWTNNGNGGYDMTLLCCVTNQWKNADGNNQGIFQFDMPVFAKEQTLANGALMPMRLAVYEEGGATMIVAAVGGDAGGDQTKMKWHYLSYLDSSDERLKSGTYGVLTANSAGIFKDLKVANVSTGGNAKFWGGEYEPGDFRWHGTPAPNVGSYACNRTTNSVPVAAPYSLDIPYPSLSFTSCKSEIQDEFWVEIPGRNECFIDGTQFGVKAADVKQTVSVLASKDTGDAKYDTVLATYTIDNCWGTIKEDDYFGVTNYIWRAEDARLRFRTGGDLDGIRTDVVIDNINVYQWRGRNQINLYGDASPDNESESPHVVNGSPEDFVFTSGWVTERSGGTAVELSAKRTIKGRPASVRTPLMDGIDGRGSGLGNLQFSWRNCQPNTRILVQIATNVNRSALAELTRDVSASGGSGSWRTVVTMDYGDLGDSGSTNVVFGARIGNGGGAVARIVIDPELVELSEAMRDPEEFGSIEITEAYCQDEPPIDKGCWWGWNIRTIGDPADSESRMYLPDANERPVGYSIALNNSVTDEVVPEKQANYTRHMPFIQSPSFTNENVIGEVSFRARKYSTSEYDQYAEVAVYGITVENLNSGLDDEWVLLNRFVISNTVFTTYNYRVLDDGLYAAIRLGVTGITGVDPMARGPESLVGDQPARVLLDEVSIYEAVTPELAIRNVGAFRSDLQGGGVVPGVPCKEEQPLCEEAWGVQCELYAVMLEDQIDTRHPPRVKLYWYEGEDDWGVIKRDKNAPGVHSGWMARATDTDALIYRSSYDTAPDAVIPSSRKDGYPVVVQFMIEVYYTTFDPQTGYGREMVKMIDVKNEWKVPKWYEPLDYNTDPNYNTTGDRLSCFCVLDDLAPGWAWINEVNLLNFNSAYYENDDENCQFIEIAAPQGIDLSGWRIDILESDAPDGAVITNTIAMFGQNGLSGTKSVNAVSNYVFHVIANPDHGNGLDREVLKRTGALDGTWDMSQIGRNTDALSKNGTIEWMSPIGIRLVRPNGIVEHEILAIGIDDYFTDGSLYYNPTNALAFLNETTKPGTFFYPEDDAITGDHSLGVINTTGLEGADNWNNTMRRTPGEINEGQQINPDYPLPMGDMVYIFSELDQSGGNIWQSFDGVNFTNETIRTFVRKGSTVGTNVVYMVEPWYEIAYARQVDGDIVTYLDVSNGFDIATRQVEVNMGLGCSNRVTVTARARPDHQLRDLGCDEDNIYTPAVIKWLQEGSTLRNGGTPFANSDGVLRPAEFWGLHSGPTDPPTYLTLTEMYWLDIDPTVGDMVLQAGISTAPYPYPSTDAELSVTNDRLSVFIMITNKTDSIMSPYYGQAWSPYVLRGAEPGETSWDYTPGSGHAWTSETFKVSGLILNGHTSADINDNWVDLRYFVFLPDSFYQPEDEPAHRRFTADIEIIDPVNSKSSPGYGAGWYDWVRDNESTLRPVYRCRLDTRLRPFEVELLQTNNYYTVTGP